MDMRRYERDGYVKDDILIVTGLIQKQSSGDTVKSSRKTIDFSLTMNIPSFN